MKTEMQRALEADGEKLRTLTGEDHGPWEPEEPNPLYLDVGEMLPQRKYLPTLSDLIDRLTIALQKSVFIQGKRKEYLAEMEALISDIDLILRGLDRRIGGCEVHAIVSLMFLNRAIWENETIIRAGKGSRVQDVEARLEEGRRLMLTHSINGQRNEAKNVLAELDGGRKDYKIDALAEELIAEFGHWQIFE